MVAPGISRKHKEYDKGVDITAKIVKPHDCYDFVPHRFNAQKS